MDDEQQAIDRLLELTNGDADADVARAVLSSVDWDVQRAADLIFGHAPSPSTMQPFDIDDSHQPTVRPRQPVGRPLWTWLTLPFHLLTSILRFVFGVLRIPLPRFATLTFYLPLSRRGHSSSAPPKGPEAWLRQLEDETGAISVGRIRPRASASGVASSTAASSSGADASLTSRARAAGDDDHDTDGRKRLPDFMLSSYEDFLRACQRDTRIGCVILVSAEHDDVADFKRSTLTDSAFIKTLQDNNILVWGGDVRDREAWSASEKLQATTYPFVAFIALQPQRGTRSSSLLSSSSPSPSSEPTLTVLSRHQGPAVTSAYTSPSSTPTPSPIPDPSASSSQHATTPTSAPALLAHLHTALLPRVAPFLASLRAARVSAQTALERSRQLRAEQDAAFAASAARDRARIEARMAAEREERARAEQQKAEEERRAREEQMKREERERREKERAAWRLWARKAIVGGLRQPGGASAADLSYKRPTPVLRIAVRLPSGARIVHSFDLSDAAASSSTPPPTLTTLFALVDTAFISDALRPADDPALPPSSSSSSAPSHTAQAGSKSPVSILDAHILSLLAPPSSNKNTAAPAPAKDAETAFWSFRLLTAYPRAELPWTPATPLSAVALLNPRGGGGAQLVVELVSSEEGAERRRSGDAGQRRSGEHGRKSVEVPAGRRSVESANGGGLGSRDGPTRVGNGSGNGVVSGSGKGKAKDAQQEEQGGEDSDDGYKTESSDEE